MAAAAGKSVWTAEDIEWIDQNCGGIAARAEAGNQYGFTDLEDPMFLLGYYMNACPQD